MTVAELIEVLRSMPQDTPVAVPDYGSNQTSLDVELSLTSVYGTLCVVIASAYDGEV
jgi:hypothetical protein